MADEGQVLVTNRGGAQLAWLDATSLQCLGHFDTAPRPNGAAIIARSRLAVAACIGDETHRPELQVIELPNARRSVLALPGRPRWCVADAAGTRIFLAVREPSMVLVVRLPKLDEVQHWPLPSPGAHGLDIDHQTECLYAACDGRTLVALSSVNGEIRAEWPLAGSPDATFFNPASGLVHVAIEEPGQIQIIDPRTGIITSFATAPGAPTTALVPPDHLYVFSPCHGGVLDLVEELPRAPHAGVYKSRLARPQASRL